MQPVTRFLAAERDRLPLWAPVPVMGGIAAYFALADEPPSWMAMPFLAAGAALLAALWRTRWRWIAAAICLLALGFSAAHLRTHLVATPLLTTPLEHAEVEGTIDYIDLEEKGVRLILAQPVIEGVPPEQTPVRIRIAFRTYDPAWRIGQRIRTQAMLYPLPQPSLPGGYDFARHLYFLGIGATGFAFAPPEVLAQEDPLTSRQRLDALRHTIGDDMRAAMPGEVGDIAAAMTVGETGPIPDDAKSALRDAGLSHMLAIAGLHLGLAAAFVFFTMRLLLSLWPPIALRVPVKKIAAGCALAAAFFYLLLAGRPIPAQRSFIMAAFVLGGVMLDRRGISFRSLMLAAIFILLVMPESLFGASFQMSFAATIAIVALYERFGAQLYSANATFVQSLKHHALGIAGTSLVATFATAPFVLYNFNRFASFGVVANMLVIPLAALVIMPGVVVSLALMPFGLQHLGYLLLSHGVAWMLAAARWVTSLPGAAILQPAPMPIGVVASALGLMWLCLVRSRLRLAGIPIMLAGVATMALHAPPDVFVSGNGHQVMVRTEDGGYTMLKGQARAFAAQAWLRAEGQEEAVPARDTDAACTRDLCDYTLRGNRILVLRRPQEDEVRTAACAEKSALLIAWWYLRAGDCPGPLSIIDRTQLEAHGAEMLWLAGAGIKIRRVWEGARHAGRPWELAGEGEE